MLEEIRIKDLGVIEEATLRLGRGFTAITGETGAGKTMILTGLSLLFGGRAEAIRVRHGAARAEIDATLVLDGASESSAHVISRIEEIGGVVEEGHGHSTVLLSRTVSSEGRSKAIAGGRPVPAAVLADIADHVVAVHGQADQRRLLQPQAQRDMVDRFGGEDVASALVTCRAAYDTWRALMMQLQTLRRDSAALSQEADGLKDDLAKVEALNPQPGEDHALAEESMRLGHAETLRAAADAAHLLLAGDVSASTSVLDAIAAARKALDQQRQHDPRLAELSDAMGEQAAILTDVAAELSSYSASIDEDPLRLAWVEQRRADLAGLTRRHGTDINGVLAWVNDARERLLVIDDDGSLEARLEESVVRARSELELTAAHLSMLRRTGADEITRAGSRELSDLAMGGSRIEVVVTPCEIGPDGGDEVSILLCNGPQRIPLGKGASGGELSRIMLALEVVIAHRDPVPVMVFDEVDAGVGGRAAIEVGRRLCRLAADAQVIVVTHLPQVAAFADHHVVVRKESDGSTVSSGVTLLSESDRVVEIARMLAGLEESSAATQHARELLDLAEGERAARP
jgi:DNA repair protein RecN (Recombination protein N)